MNLVGDHDHDIHQVFARAVPSQDWCSQVLVVALVDVRDWESCLPSASMLLDAAENLRMQRKRNQGDREFLAWVYALHRLLLGTSSAWIRWQCRYGEMRLVVLGSATISCIPSLSHGGDWIALAVSRAGPVGVDIEPLARMDMLPEMGGSICDSYELVELEAVAIDQRGRALLALWVRKKALLKAVGADCRWK